MNCWVNGWDGRTQKFLITNRAENYKQQHRDILLISDGGAEMDIKKWGSILFAIIILTFSGGAIAQEYPTRAVHLVVGAAAGGGSDFVARVVAAKLKDRLKQPVIVENRGGAAGAVASDYVAKSAPDGYTLLLVFSNFATYPSLKKHLSFDIIKSFAPVVELGATPLVLVVRQDLPVKNIQGLIKYAKSKPEGLNYAAPGIGSMGHLAAELFKRMAHVNMTAIAYRGGGPSVKALLSGEVQLYFSTIAAALSQIQASKLRALGVSSTTRIASLPEVPTIAESGLPGYRVIGWFGVFAPANTSSTIIGRLNSSINSVLKLPEIKQRLAREGLEPIGGSPNDLAQLVKSDKKKWTAVIKAAGITVQ
jgi:tripartite-type tricarboxylate transporter receptor subunit TctC